jgi:hypothetical protein
MIKITGTIKKILPTQAMSGGFEKRIFWLLDDDQKYPNNFQLECWKADTIMLDDYNEGDKIIAYVDLKGKLFTGRDGEEKIMNTMKCWNIEKDGKMWKKIP